MQQFGRLQNRRSHRIYFLLPLFNMHCTVSFHCCRIYYKLIAYVVSCFFLFFFLFRFCRVLFYAIDTAEVVITQLKEKSKAVSLTQLATFVDTLPEIERDLQRMKEITAQLRVNASQLSNGIEIILNLLAIK